MYEATKIHILQQADMLCVRLGITPSDNNVVLFIGDDTAVSNLDAVKNWVAAQTDLNGLGRMTVQNALYERLAGHLDRRVGELVH